MLLEAVREELWNCSTYEKCCSPREGDFFDGEAALQWITAVCVLFHTFLACCSGFGMKYYSWTHFLFSCRRILCHRFFYLPCESNRGEFWDCKACRERLGTCGGWRYVKKLVSTGDWETRLLCLTVCFLLLVVCQIAPLSSLLPHPAPCKRLNLFFCSLIQLKVNAF